jgi:hypothetical protein
MKHHIVALLIGLSFPVTFPSCMTANSVINTLEQQIAVLRASLAREQALTRKLMDDRRFIETQIANDGPNPQRIRQLQETNQALDANAAKKASLEQEIRRLKQQVGSGIDG